MSGLMLGSAEVGQLQLHSARGSQEGLRDQSEGAVKGSTFVSLFQVSPSTIIKTSCQ